VSVENQLKFQIKILVTLSWLEDSIDILSHYRSNSYLMVTCKGFKARFPFSNILPTGVLDRQALLLYVPFSGMQMRK